MNLRLKYKSGQVQLIDNEKHYFFHLFQPRVVVAVDVTTVGWGTFRTSAEPVDEINGLLCFLLHSSQVFISLRPCGVNADSIACFGLPYKASNWLQ